MPRRNHAPHGGPTKGRRASRPGERSVAEALAWLEQVYADATPQGSRYAAETVLDAASRLLDEARAARGRAASMLAARVERLETESRRTRER